MWETSRAGDHTSLMLAAFVGLIYPVIRFQSSVFSGAIGLFILFIGMRAAWRMTSGIPGAVKHPFAR